MKNYLLTGFLLSALLSGGIVFAHGGAEESTETLHPETQIGLPGSRMGHDDMGTVTEGLTRGEVAALISDTQTTEEKRSAIKLALLLCAIAGLVYLYFPRKPVIASASTIPNSPVSQDLPSPLPAAKTDDAHEHSP